MMRFPEIQRRAQEQIDSVIGQERLPNFSDEKSLPYISAMVKELLRSDDTTTWSFQRL
jgi:cytochrome P450